MPDIEIYADGACLGNPGPGGWGAILIDHGTKTVKELGGRAPATTNNAMEIQAAAEGLEAAMGLATPGRSIVIKTDSAYVIQGATQWISGWRGRGWVTREGTPVANQDGWERLDGLQTVIKKTATLRWEHVPGHSGVPGNERADEIASAFAAGETIRLLSGPWSQHPLSQPATSTWGGSWPIYLSLVAGKLERHKTWPECEARVKGTSGAKFRKVSSPSEESKVLQEWKLTKMV